MKVFNWPNQSPDLYPIQIICHLLEQAVHMGQPSNVAKLTVFSREEGAKLLHNKIKILWGDCGSVDFFPWVAGSMPGSDVSVVVSLGGKLPAGGGLCSAASVSVPQGTCGYKVAYHHQCVNK